MGFCKKFILVALLFVADFNQTFAQNNNEPSDPKSCGYLLGAFDQLPLKGTNDWEKLRSQLVSDLDPKTGKGFSILETANCFPSDLSKRFALEFPPPLIVFFKHNIKYPFATKVGGVSIMITEYS